MKFTVTKINFEPVPVNTRDPALGMSPITIFEVGVSRLLSRLKSAVVGVFSLFCIKMDIKSSADMASFGH